MTDKIASSFSYRSAALQAKVPEKVNRAWGEKVPNSGESFVHILQKSKIQKELSFSAHARRRMRARNIVLEGEELGRLEKAVEKAAAKGCRSSLLLYKDMAFLAGIPNRTIITALDSNSMKEHVFTNIDSAVVIE